MTAFLDESLLRAGNVRRGSALVVSLIAIVTLAALGAAFLRITTSLTSRQTNDVENTKAFYVAEAGLAEAFQAVRMGRTGQLGAEAAPARFGDGLVWVDATTTGDQQVRLESTALVGRGRASLAYVVEPVEVPLGFFGDEELVVESVLLVDGYDSEAGGYESQVMGHVVELNRNDPFLHVDPVAGIVFNDGWFYRYQASEGDTYFYDHAIDFQVLAADPDYNSRYDLQGRDFTDSDYLKDYVDVEYEGVLAYFASIPVSGAVPSGATFGTVGPTTGGGGLLGSDGNVVFQAASGEPVEVYGDVTPGPSGSIVGLGAVDATGTTEPRPQLVELPEVRVPAVMLDAPLRHEDLLPMLVPAGAVGYERIEVAADAELILQGPSTVVIGTLILEPGATLSLDTRDGDVALYVTRELDMQPGSLVTTSEDPTEATVLVPEIPTGVEGAPIRLDATAQFHGAIYAPLTDVRIGGEFEIYGGVIAKRLEIGAGARLHFDNAGFEDSPIPRIVSWRIVEIPSTVRGARDPFARLGLTAADLEPLAECHDLAAVQMVVTYLDHGGMLRTYEGSEDLFDWGLVAEVIEVDRNPDRKGGDGAVEPPPTEPASPLTQAEQDLVAAIQDGSLTSGELSTELRAMAPVSEAVLLEAILAQPPMGTWDLYNALKANGPPAPGYGDGKRSAALSDDLLVKIVHDSPLASKDLSWILEQNSPLSAQVLDAARTREPAMKTSDLTYVDRAQ